MLNMATGCHCLRMSSPRLARGRHSQLHAVYAVTIATQQRQPLFVATALAGLVSNLLSQSDREGATQTHAWVLMPDHLHWLFALQTGNLADVMRRLKSRSARAINAARATTGPVWQAGYYDHHIRDHEDLFAQAHYLIANPVRKGLVDNPHRYPHWGCQWLPNQYPIPRRRA
jgi:REP element-mobilizing transposase RayT